MSKSRKQYTFEDWDQKQFILPRFPEEGKVSQFELTQQLSQKVIQDLPLALYKIGRMPEEEFNKIREKQKKAYEILLDYHIKKSLEKLKEHEDGKVYARKRRVYIEKLLDETEAKIIEDATSNPDFSRLSNRICDEIINRQKNNKPQHSYKMVEKDPITGKVVKRYRLSESFEISILIAEIEAIGKKINSDSPQSQSVEELISEFADSFVQDRRVTYSAKQIESYIKYHNKYSYSPEARSKAKRKLKELHGTEPADGTLSNWEDQWENFKESRT